MQIDEATIRHVASVARIHLTDDEVKEFLPQLKEILMAFSEIGEVDTEGVEPSFHATRIEDSLREDVPSGCLDNDSALANTEHKRDGYFKGPKVI